MSFQVHTRVLKWDSLKYKTGTRSVCEARTLRMGQSPFLFKIHVFLFITHIYRKTREGMYQNLTAVLSRWWDSGEFLFC